MADLLTAGIDYNYKVDLVPEHLKDYELFVNNVKEYGTKTGALETTVAGVTLTAILNVTALTVTGDTIYRIDDILLSDAPLPIELILDNIRICLMLACAG